MSEIRIPSTLRASTGGAKAVTIDGGTVGEILDSLVIAYPALRAQLLTEDGTLNRFVNVYLNATDVRHLDGLATPVVAADELVLLPAMAGGADRHDPSAGDLAGRCACPGRAEAS